MFIQNKYSKYYYSIITNAKSRILADNIRTEMHHIIPECFFIRRSRKGKPGWIDGNPEDPSNKVILTDKEHFICHKLLTKMTEGKAKIKMMYAYRAFALLSSNGRIIKINSREFEKIRKLGLRKGAITLKSTKLKIGKANKGNKAWNKGIAVPASQKAQQSATRKSKNGMPGFNVRPSCRPEKAKAISDAQKGRKIIYYPDTNERKPVDPLEVEKYLSLGWKLGQGKRKLRLQKGIKTGMKWVYNPATNQSKQSKPDQFDMYLNDGWLPGRILQKYPITQLSS
jgi:hypothetical protein